MEEPKFSAAMEACDTSIPAITPIICEKLLGTGRLARFDDSNEKT